MNGNAQKPFSNNQVKNNKPNVPRSTGNILTGTFQGSANGGHNKTKSYFYVMAGQRIDKLMWSEKIRILTPKTPPYQKLFVTYRVYNVPHINVFKDYEKFVNQKGGASIEKVETLPHFTNYEFPMILDEDHEKVAQFTDSTSWRDCIFSPYYPRVGRQEQDSLNNQNYTQALPVSILPMRGRIQIYNEFERNKEYDPEMPINTDLDTSDIEGYIDQFAGPNNFKDFQYGRAKNPNNYYSDYRTELQGIEKAYPPSEMSSDTSLENWMANFENYIAESRSQAENANLNDNELFAKLRGSQLLTEGRITKIAEKTFPLNYSSITQTNYNNIAQEADQWATGTQGGYSYTELNFPILESIKFKEDGIVHIIATVWAEKIYETGVERMNLNVGAYDIYRPDMLDKKKDVLYAIETGTINIKGQIQEEVEKVIGFKRAYTEYFKLPNITDGDMYNAYYFDYDIPDGEEKFNGVNFNGYNEENISTTANSYQFNQSAMNLHWDVDTKQYLRLNGWQDYTDILINKNLAYKYLVLNGSGEEEAINRYWIIIPGKNQIQYVGHLTMITDLPIDDSIKANYTTWGEH